MRAVVCQRAELGVVDRPEPMPGPGQVRLDVMRCGICGSDLHARHGIDAWADMAAAPATRGSAAPTSRWSSATSSPARVAEYGPGCRREIPTGTPVVALPLVRGAAGVDAVGLSLHAPGAYAEQVLAQESMMLAVPNGLPPDVAALTEPMAVAWHAVRRGEVGKRDVAIVIGCGPVGLGVILLPQGQGRADRRGQRLLARPARAGAAPAAPTSSSTRRRARRSRRLDERGPPRRGPAAFELALTTREKLGRLPVGWWHLWRLGEKLGAGPKRPVIFECVGVPGVIDSILAGAPLFSRVVVVGVCVGRTASRRRWPSTRRSTCGSSSATRRPEFRDTLTCWPRARSTPAAHHRDRGPRRRRGGVRRAGRSGGPRKGA